MEGIYSAKMKGPYCGRDSKARTPEERQKAIIKAYRKYDAVADDSCDPGTTVLKNKLDLTDGRARRVRSGSK